MQIDNRKKTALYKIDVSRIIDRRFPIQRLKPTRTDLQLADDIARVGLSFPIAVRAFDRGKVKEPGPYGHGFVERSRSRYEVVIGQRRFAALRSLGMREIPCRIHEYSGDAAADVAALLNNLRKPQRPHPYDAAVWLAALKRRGCSYKWLAGELEETEAALMQTAALFGLCNEMATLYAEGRISREVAQLFAARRPDIQRRAAGAIHGEGIAVNDRRQLNALERMIESRGILCPE